jgi:hypothetical protein
MGDADPLACMTIQSRVSWITGWAGLSKTWVEGDAGEASMITTTGTERIAVGTGRGD